MGSKTKPQDFAIKIKYSDLKAPIFQQAMQKISNTELDTKSAGHIYQLVKRVNEASKQIASEFDADIIQIYGKKDDTGKVTQDPSQQSGFALEEGKEDEAQKAIKAFGEREAVIEWRPLNPVTLAGVKMTAHELDALGDLFSMEVGPGLPGNVQEMFQHPHQNQ